MRASNLSIPPILVALGAIATARAANVSLSGRVVLPDGKGKAGVALSIQVGTDVLQDTTDADGNWSLGATTAVGPSPRAAFRTSPLPTAHLSVHRGRLRLELDGRDLLGKQAPALPPAVRGIPSSARSSATVPRTTAPYELVYAYGTKNFLRDTVSDLSRSGIRRVFDTTWNGAIVYGYLTDSRDGQTYRTVKMDRKVWMAQNLDLQAPGSWSIAGDSTGWRFGRLYGWAAAQGLPDSCDTRLCATPVAQWRGICPAGWHLPTRAEWELIMDGSARAATDLKAIDFAESNIEGRTDPHGFHAEPAGQMRSPTWRNDGAYFWTNPTEPWDTSSEGLRIYAIESLEPDWTFLSKAYGQSVRCVEDTLGID